MSKIICLSTLYALQPVSTSCSRKPLGNRPTIMDPPGRESPAVIRPRSRAQPPQGSPLLTTSTPPLTLAPSAMSDAMPQDQSAASRQDTVNPHAVVGQISATQTMVVTTTTTTTTSFPPLLLNPPKHLHDMDPKQYPLAASPTPTTIRKLCFDVEGRTTTFEEAGNLMQNSDNVCTLSNSFHVCLVRSRLKESDFRFHDSNKQVHTIALPHAQCQDLRGKRSSRLHYPQLHNCRLEIFQDS